MLGCGMCDYVWKKWKILGTIPILTLVTRDKTGTSRYKIGTAGTKQELHGQQGQNRTSRFKTGVAMHKAWRTKVRD